jgi:hypothetical protein
MFKFEQILHYLNLFYKLEGKAEMKKSGHFDTASLNYLRKLLFMEVGVAGMW